MAGFTLIELMVTVSILAVLASLALAGFRQNDARNQTRRFIDDVEGLLVTARDVAMDEQTRTQLIVSATQATVNRFDHTTNMYVLVGQALLNEDVAERQLIARDGAVCIQGLTPGAMTPSQATDITPPEDCAEGVQTLQFEADGSFTDPDAGVLTAENGGVTLWISDRRVAAAPRATILQIFPGGLVRRIETAS